MQILSRTGRYRVIGDSAGGSWPPPFENTPVDGGVYRRSDLPFILEPDGHYDVQLNMYWSDSAAALLATSSLLLYARHLARFLDFVWHSRSPGSEPRRWRDVTQVDRLAYSYWRNDDLDGPRVASSTWNNEVFAVNQFYSFQVSVGNLATSPIRTVTTSRRERVGGAWTTKDTPGELRRLRKSSAPWFTPAEYRRWRDIGIRGFLPSGVRDPTYRGAQSARNAVFADLMLGVGLRLSEQASLILSEIPEPGGDRMYSWLSVSPFVAKNRSARRVLVAERVLRALETYIRTDRADAVHRARESSAYELVEDKLLVDEFDTFRNASGRRTHCSESTPSERRRLFKDAAGGLEPLALWVTADGLPMRSRTWQRIFADANARVAKHNVDLVCNVHKLRHSWATITLAQLQRRYNSLRSGATEGAVIGDPLNWVSRRLGHRRIETTMIYIHNLNELETETILSLIPDVIDLVASPPDQDVRFDFLGIRLE